MPGVSNGSGRSGPQIQSLHSYLLCYAAERGWLTSARTIQINYPHLNTPSKHLRTLHYK